MDEAKIIQVLFERVWLILTLTLVATLVGYAGSFLLETKYTSSALVLLRPQQAIKLDSRNSTSKEFLDFPMGQSTVETPSKTYIEIIKSPALVGQLVHKLTLDAPVEGTFTKFLKRLPDSVRVPIDDLRQFLKDSVTFLMYGSVIKKDPFAEAVKSVQDNLALEARTDTYIFAITFTAKEAQLAADVANTTARLFIDFMEAARRSEGKYISDQLRPQVEQSLRQLNTARRNLEAFKKTHSIFRYEPEYDAYLKVISELHTELAKIDESLAALIAVANEKSLSTVNLVAKRDSILRTIRERQAKLEPLPGIERELKQLELDVSVAVTAYEIVEKEFKGAEIKNSYAAREVQLVSEAVPPHLPSAPRRMIITLVSLLSGLVVGIGLAFLSEFLNRRIRSVRDVEDFVGVRVLATIPRISESRWRLAGV